MNSTSMDSREKKLALRVLAEKYPWLAAYVTSFGSPTKAGGRPPSVFPRKSYHCSLTREELSILTTWQKRLDPLLVKKPSRGETVGLLTQFFHIIYAEAQPNQAEKPKTLDELLEIFQSPKFGKQQELKELAKTYPYLGMVAASLENNRRATHFNLRASSRTSYSLRLTRVEASLLDEWQEILRQLAGEKLSRGEVVGLITGIVSIQFDEITKIHEYEGESLEELLKLLEITK